MTVHLSKHNITYISVPKVACTSLKRFFFEIENGFQFHPFRMNGKLYRIHQFANSPKFSKLPMKKIKGHAKIAVVRNPWERILSCYASKVASNKALKGVEFSPQQREMGLVENPSLDTFVDLLPQYRAVSWDIKHHSEPLSTFLGTDPKFFDRIFSIRQLPELVAYVGDRIGAVPVLPHENKGTANIGVVAPDVVARNRPKIEEIYAEDIEIFGKYMS